MTLQQLRYIIAIEQYRHFGKAAEACGLTQSTLSLMVKKLEEELDVNIFDRDSHPVSPTEMGRKIIDQAKVALYNVEQITEITRSEKESLSGPLNLALISTVAPILVPGLFKFICTSYPSISLKTEEMLTDTIKDKLRKAEVDMGIVSGPVKDQGFMELPLYHERFYAYISPDNPSYCQETIHWDNLREQSVWMIKDGLRKLDIDELKKGETVHYERFFEGGRVGLLIQIVNENGGMTIIPETHLGLIPQSMHKGLRPIVSPDVSRTISLAIRSDYIHEAKLNVVVDAIKSIIPKQKWDNFICKDHLKL
ncbi:MAG: LysR family transcriptional regulator [Bacteroidales bacterium]|nr:LysR family transcriptional regulator [Bacteroidales bacterium]